MKSIVIASIILLAVVAGSVVRADEANPDVAKAIQDIAARRAEKDAAKAKQIESWRRNEERENGRPAAPAPGAQIRK